MLERSGRTEEALKVCWQEEEETKKEEREKEEMSPCRMAVQICEASDVEGVRKRERRTEGIIKCKFVWFDLFERYVELWLEEEERKKEEEEEEEEREKEENVRLIFEAMLRHIDLKVRKKERKKKLINSI